MRNNKLDRQNLVEYQKEINILIEKEENDVNYLPQNFLSIVLNHNNYLINLNDIKETSTIPNISKIGRIKPWFLGIANFRGQVSPVIDMTYLFTGKNSNLHQSYALLTSDRLGTSFAMLWTGVSKLLSMKNFTLSTEVIQSKDKWIKTIWVDSENVKWKEIDVENLIISPELSDIYNADK